jgi:hypothetical protein
MSALSKCDERDMISRYLIHSLIAPIIAQEWPGTLSLFRVEGSNHGSVENVDLIAGLHKNNTGIISEKQSSG